MQVGVQTGFEKETVEVPGSPVTERVTGCAVPERSESVTVEVTLLPGSTVFAVPAFIEKFHIVKTGGVLEVIFIK